MNNPRWKIRPEGSTWGDFGPDDQLGRLNLLTPQKVKQGVAEVREGLAFCLSLPLDYPGGSVLNPSRKPPLITPTQYDDGRPRMNFPLDQFYAGSTDIVCDDQVLLSLQYSTQWDSLAHIGARFDADGDGKEDMVYYNGYRAHQHITGPHDYDHDHECAGPFGAQALGIENMAQKAIQGRGVLVDLHAHFGDTRQAIGYDDMMRVMQADKVEIETGDMLVLHTGFTHLIKQMNKQPDKEKIKVSGVGLDGRDEKLLQWITDVGIAAICADNYAVEHYPALPPTHPGKAPMLPLHQHCLFKLGVPLAELWWLKDLAAWLRANQRNRFLLTAPPLNLPGAVGSPVTPVATV